MAYPTAAEFGGSQGYLNQLDIAEPDILAKVNNVLTRAQEIVDNYLRFTFAGFTDATDKNVRAQFGPYFVIPAHEFGSISAVTTIAGTAITDFEELQSGVLYAYDPDTGYEHEWNGAMYTITANWGYGDCPADVAEVVLELAVNIWRSAESGHFTNVIGASDGGNAVGYEAALTPRQKMALKNARRARVPLVI